MPFKYINKLTNEVDAHNQYAHARFNGCSIIGYDVDTWTLNSRLMQIVNTYKGAEYFFIKHDKDENQEHYHIVLYNLPQPISFKQLEMMFDMISLNIVVDMQGYLIKNIYSLVHYLVHERDKDKISYSFDEVFTNADIEQYYNYVSTEDDFYNMKKATYLMTEEQWLDTFIYNGTNQQANIYNRNHYVFDKLLKMSNIKRSRKKQFDNDVPF